MTVKEGRIKDDEHIYMVLEYGEIDLAHMLSQKWKEMDSSNWRLDENWLRFYWQVFFTLLNFVFEGFYWLIFFINRTGEPFGEHIGEN